MTTPIEIYYVGCVDQPGHYIWDLGMKCLPYNEVAKRLPWGLHIDGCIPPKTVRWQGVVRVERKDGWTAFGFWDNSIDSRPGSHSTFVISGEWSFNDALSIARSCFPSIFARFTFEVREVVQ